MRVVVVGATGNVGSRVVAALSADSAIESVVGVARRVPNNDLDLAKLEWRAADVRHGRLTDLFNGADAVIHLAWRIQPVRDVGRLRRINVDGTRRVIETAIDCGVPTVVCASSVGTYAPDATRIPRGEDWPHTGIESSIYSQHKAEVESWLDTLGQESTRVVRLRTALVFQRHAASEIVRFFLGPFAPSRLIGRRGLPVFPDLDGVRLQVVHAADAAEAYRAVLHRPEAKGAFNIAAKPVLTTADLAEVFGARPLRMPKRLIRAGAAATFALHLQPTSPGWVDLAFGVPVMDTTAARRDLGWEPRHDALDTVAELRAGLAHDDGTSTAALEPNGRLLRFPTAVHTTATRSHTDHPHPDHSHPDHSHPDHRAEAR